MDENRTAPSFGGSWKHGWFHGKAMSHMSRGQTLHRSLVALRYGPCLVPISSLCKEFWRWLIWEFQQKGGPKTSPNIWTIEMLWGLLKRVWALADFLKVSGYYVARFIWGSVLQPPRNQTNQPAPSGPDKEAKKVENSPIGLESISISISIPISIYLYPYQNSYLKFCHWLRKSASCSRVSASGISRSLLLLRASLPPVPLPLAALWRGALLLCCSGLLPRDFFLLFVHYCVFIHIIPIHC